MQEYDMQSEHSNTSDWKEGINLYNGKFVK